MCVCVCVPILCVVINMWVCMCVAVSVSGEEVIADTSVRGRVMDAERERETCTQPLTQHPETLTQSWHAGYFCPQIPLAVPPISPVASSTTSDVSVCQSSQTTLTPTPTPSLTSTKTPTDDPNQHRHQQCASMEVDSTPATIVAAAGVVVSTAGVAVGGKEYSDRPPRPLASFSKRPSPTTLLATTESTSSSSSTSSSPVLSLSLPSQINPTAHFTATSTSLTPRDNRKHKMTTEQTKGQTTFFQRINILDSFCCYSWISIFGLSSVAWIEFSGEEGDKHQHLHSPR